MVDQNCPGIDFLQLANDVRPILHRVLNIRDASDFELAVFLDRLLGTFRDGLGIGNLLLNDMDLTVLRLPNALLLRMVQPQRKSPTIIHLRGDWLQNMAIFFGIRFDRLRRHSVRGSVEEGTFVLRRCIHRRKRRQHIRVRNRVDLSINALRNSLFAALRRQRIEVDDHLLQFAAKDAAGFIDLVDGQGRAVDVIAMIRRADRRRRRRRYADHDRL